MTEPFKKYDVSNLPDAGEQSLIYDVSSLPDTGSVPLDPADIYSPEVPFQQAGSFVGTMADEELVSGIGRVSRAFPVGVREAVRRKAASYRFQLERQAEDEERLPHPADPLSMEESAAQSYARLTYNERVKVDAEVTRLQEEGESEDVAFRQALLNFSDEKRQKRIDALSEIEQAQILQTPEEFQGESTGIMEDVSRVVGGSAIDVGLTLAGTIAGGPIGGAVVGGAGIYSTIHGATVELLEQYDVPAERIAQAAAWNAAVQTPLEWIGNMIQVGKILKPRGTWGLFVKDLAGAFLGEAVTETAQSFPDQFIISWALNPDLSPSELIAHINVKEAAYEGLVGGLAGGVTAGAGMTTRGALNDFIAPKQQLINKDREGRLVYLADKAVRGELTEEENAEIAGEFGKSGKTVDEIVTEAKKQADLLGRVDHENRTNMQKAMTARFGKEQADTTFELFDMMARGYAERNDKKPSDFYADVLTKFEAEIPGQVKEGGVEYQLSDKQEKYTQLELNFGPPEKPAAEISEELPPDNIRTRMATTGSIKAGSAKVTSAEDAANLLAHIRKSAQELFYSVAVDANNNIVEVHKYSKGAKGSTDLNTIELVGRILNLPNVAKVYMAHNHPSGSKEPSTADIGTMAHAAGMLQLADIPSENLIIADTSYVKFPPYATTAKPAASFLTPQKRNVVIPVKERVKIGKPGVQANDPALAAELVKTRYKGKNGFLLLDAQLRDLGFFEYPKGEISKKASLDLIKKIESTNATGGVFFSDAYLADIESRKQFVADVTKSLKGVFQVFDIVEQGQSKASTGGFIQPVIDTGQQLKALSRLAEDRTLFQSKKWADPIKKYQEAIAKNPDATIDEIQKDADISRYEAETIQQLISQNRAALLQPGPDEPQGAIENIYGLGPKTMKAFASANISTPIHEIGHVGLELMWQEGSVDYNTLAEWAGVDTERAAGGTQAWTKPELEKVARGFEAYMMEGKAPTSKLLDAFAKMREWLLDIYQSAKSLGVELDDNVRAVFDRWVTVEFQRSENPFSIINEWIKAEDLYTADMVRRAEARPPDETELAEYEDVQREARRRVLGKLADERAKQEKALEKEFKKEAKQSVEGVQFYDMLHDLWARGGFKLSSMQDLYDKTYIGDIVRRRPGIVSARGVTPDDFAMEWGYDYVDDLIQDVLDNPTKKEATDQYYDDLWVGYELSLEHENAVTYEEILDTEIDIISSMMGKKKPKARKELKKIIRQKTGQIKEGDYRELVETLKKDQKLSRDAFRAGKKEAKADIKPVEKERLEKVKQQARESRLQAVLKAKQHEKDTVSKLRRAAEVKDIRQKTRNRMQRIWRSPSIPYEYQAQIVDFLKEYFVIPKSFQKVPEETIDSFLNRKREDNSWAVDSIRAELTKKPVQEYNKKGYRKPLSISDLQIVGNTADMLAHMGRVEGELLQETARQDLDNTVNAMASKAYETFGYPENADEQPRPPSARKLEWYRSMSEKGKGFLSEMRKAEFILQALDGWKFDGPNWQLFQMLKKAEDAEFDLGDKFFAQIKAAFGKQFNRKWAIKKHTIPGMQHMLTKEEMIMIMLNSGNEGNLAAVKTGFGIDDDVIDSIEGQLTDDERKLILNIWKIIDRMFPHLDRVHRKITGAPLTKVEGKYFPLVFDRELTWQAGTFAQMNELRDMFATAYTRPTVEAGHRQARRGAKWAPLLSFSVIRNHLVNTIHDTTHQIAVRDAQKIINHPNYRTAVTQTVGDSTYRQLMPWLQDIAKPRREPSTRIDKWVGRVRRNATIVALGLKVTVAQKQMLSLTQTVDELGLKPVLKAMSHFYTNPGDSTAFIKESSAMIRNRRRQWDRDLAQFTSSFNPKEFRGSEDVKNAFFAMIGFMDSVATYPTWLAGYNEGMKQFENDHAKSVEFADQVVRRTQPVAAPKDLSTMQRGGETRSELRKIFTMFYTFFSVFQNRMQETNQRLKTGDINVIEAMKSYWWIMIFPAVLAGMIQRRELPSGESAKDILGYWLAGFPFVRDIFGPMLTGFGYTMSPVEAGLKAPSELYRAFYTKKERGRKVLKHATRVVGYTFGLPANQMIITMDGMIDLSTGQTRDLSRLVFYEKRDKKKRR